MAIECQSCGARNGDDESSCSLCGVPFASHERTYTGPMPEREVTATDPVALREPVGESTGGFEANIRGVVVGGRIAERYLVKEMLGRGGVAMVFRATDETLGEEIALKVFPNLTRQDPADLERFKREILVNRRISHVNVIRLHDFGTIGDDAFLTMELLRGGTLAEKIEEKPLPIAEAVEIAIGVAEGLQAAHQAGIIHRDVKPENVLFDESGRPKLVDFGLARLVDATTHTRGFSGTPFYMSPEQANGDDITAQTDVYSIGVLLFELFTGQLPFFADSLVRIAMLHANEPPPKPSSLRPGLPPALEQLVLACLAKPPASRPAGAAAVAASLRKFRRDGGLDQARSLDKDPSFSTPRHRPRRPQSDRTEIHAPADAPPRRSNPDEATSEKIVAPSASRETVMVRVTPPSPSPPLPPPSPPPPPPWRSDGTLIVRDPGSGPVPKPVAPKPIAPKPVASEPLPVRVAPGPAKRPSELPMPRRRSPVWLLGGAAVLLLAGAAGLTLSGIVPRVWPPAVATPFSATPLPTLSLAVAPPTPRATTEVLGAPSPTPTPTPAATRTRTPAPATPTPRATATRVAVGTAPPATPRPTAKPIGRGKIKLTVIPWVSVFVDGKKQGADLAHHTIPVRSGAHRLRLENFDRRFKAEVEVTVKDGQTCVVPVIDLTRKQKPVLVPPPGC